MTPAHQKLLNGVLAGVLLAGAAGVVHLGAPIMAADWTSFMVRRDVSRWASGKVTFSDAQWERARLDLERAVSLTPNDATLHDALAQLQALKGHSLWTSGDAGSPEIDAYLQAHDHQEASIAQRPTHAMAWANLALIRLAVNSSPDELYQPWREAARLGPKEIDVENALVAIATDTWSIAPADVRQWVEARRPGLSEKLDNAPAPGLVDASMPPKKQ